jgi:hypothetical protein
VVGVGSNCLVFAASAAGPASIVTGSRFSHAYVLSLPLPALFSLLVQYVLLPWTPHRRHNHAFVPHGMRISIRCRDPALASRTRPIVFLSFSSLPVLLQRCIRLATPSAAGLSSDHLMQVHLSIVVYAHISSVTPPLPSESSCVSSPRQQAPPS